MKRPKLNGHAAIAEAVGNSFNEYLKAGRRTRRQPVRAGDWRCREDADQRRADAHQGQSVGSGRGCSASIANTRVAKLDKYKIKPYQA